ncbi:MAG: N-acetylmuramoyl-L-alanine amidase, partial [Oscillospiraceae bacterium]|nr:N-acetylmuramoyl-L-alanine amidase [Oscillospiraceae bacterium]
NKHNVVSVNSEAINAARITAKNPGTATVRARSKCNIIETADCEVTVVKPVKIYLSPEFMLKGPGALNYGMEHERMIPLARELNSYLQNRNYDSVIGDINIGVAGSEVEKRITESNNLGADLHIALHSNGNKSDSQTIFGPEVWYAKQDGTHRAMESFKLSNFIYNNLFDLYKDFSGKNDKRYGTGVVEYGTGDNILAEIRTPDPILAGNLRPGPKAIPAYVEVAYHDNEVDAKWIMTKTENIIKAIGDGIINYIKSLY